MHKDARNLAPVMLALDNLDKNNEGTFSYHIRFFAGNDSSLVHA